MDKNVSGFSKYFSLTFFVLAACLVALLFIYNLSSLRLYNVLLIICLTLLIVLISAGLMSAASLLYVYNKKTLPKILTIPFLIGLKILLPFMLSISNIFKGERDVLRRFYIENSNIYAESLGMKFKKDEVLLLLPHCLQNSDCTIRITKNINLCKECGRCPIGEIVGILRETGVKAAVATGGTAARKAIHDLQPKVVLAVACERDLVSGLSDTGELPVIGIINMRPNGPCYNTLVDNQLLKSKLEMLLNIKK